MSKTPTPLTFHNWWMTLSKVPYMTKEEIACRAWHHSAHEQAKVHRALQRGNTALLEALMDMVNQYFIHHSGGDVLTHSFMGCEEGAIAVLIEAGFAEDTSKGYVLLWDKLNERMKNYDQ